MSQAPRIDGRSAREVVARTRSLLSVHAPDWNAGDQFGGALLQAFGRLCEIVIERLNAVPEHNFLAFLDMLGASRLPPQPARVSLTFALSPGSLEDAVLPPGTQAAAPPLEKEKEAVIFETERELWVSAVELISVFARDPHMDAHADHSALAREGVAAGAPVFFSHAANEHLFYLGHDRLLDFPAIDTVALSFEIAPIDPAPAKLDARELSWETWDGTQGERITPTTSEGTNSLAQSGTVSFDFKGRAPVPRADSGGKASRWLRCRLLTPISATAAARQGMVRASHLPAILAVTITVVVNRADLDPDAGFANQIALDLSKDWFPFGERPRIGEAVYLRQDEAFARAGARVILKLKPTTGLVVNSAGSPQVRWEFWNGAAWQELMSSSSAGAITRGGEDLRGDPEFADATKAFTFKDNPPTDGPYKGQYIVRFRIPPADRPQPTEVNGMAGYWIRARLVAGNYGREARYVPDAAAPGYKFEAATLAPPMVGTLVADYSLQASEAPEAVRIRNEFDEREIALPLAPSFRPFEPPAGERAEVYLGFRLPGARTRFPNHTLSLYPAVVRPRYGERYTPLHPPVSRVATPAGGRATHRFYVTNTAPREAAFKVLVVGTGWPAEVETPNLTLLAGNASEIAVTVSVPAAAPGDMQDEGFVVLQAGAERHVARLVTTASAGIAPLPAATLLWQYWNGAKWAALGVRDDTEQFSQPGTFSLLAPPDFARREQFDLACYWLRVVWDRGEFRLPPFLQRLLPNTTMAAQAVTLENEILGSSDGSKQQRFRSTRAPVLAGPELEVREPELPPLEEQKALRAIFGERAIDVVRDATGRPREIWVRWQQVPDFYGSGPRDRHYVLDHIGGEVQFSDGIDGLIPPRGRANVRMRRYRTGGTARGNRAARTIVQLKTTVPYVERVVNLEAAGGGADAESIEALRERMPREIRHRHRSVTREDYEDLALRATPEVARAKSVPLRNLDDDPLGAAPRLGSVSVIVVPRSAERKPLPSAELLARVRDYIAERADVTAEVAVVGPLYVRVSVSVEAAVADLESARVVEQKVRASLDAFLHPLTGGMDGAGWDFGREPYRSDFHSLIHSIAGVDHIRSLQIEQLEDLAGAKAAGRYLVYSGEHRIGLSLAEA